MSRVTPKSYFRKILREAGAKRVSKKAEEEFIKLITEIAKEIAKESVKISKTVYRNTITDGDIRVAYSEFLKKHKKEEFESIL